MSETEHEAAAEEDERPVNVDENGEAIEGPADGEDGDEPDQADQPDEEEAEAAAAAEREQELAAERQEEAASIEAQQREQDAQRKKLDQLAAHAAKRYSDILGSDLGGFVGCEMCSDYWPGIRLPIMPSPETLNAIKVAIGEDPDPPLNDDPYSRQCDSCGGYGKTKTNSHVTGQTAAQCLDCGGRGWIAVGTERDSQAAPISNGAPVVAAPVPEGFPPPPLQTDAPRTPAEQELRDLGAIVVWPPKPPDMASLT